jgi:hypothetical protein
MLNGKKIDKVGEPYPLFRAYSGEYFVGVL